MKHLIFCSFLETTETQLANPPYLQLTFLSHRVISINCYPCVDYIDNGNSIL